MKSVIITGATGMIGMALTKYYMEQGVTVYAVYRPDSKRAVRIPESDMVIKIPCDIKDLLRLTGPNIEWMDCDVLFHLGWIGTTGEERNDPLVQERNIEYTLEAVQLAKRVGCKVFVGAGSQAEYGPTDSVLTADTPAYPINSYGTAKLAAGDLSRILCSQYGIKHIWTRLLSVYGPGDTERSIIMQAIKAFSRGEDFSMTLGEQIWDYIYSEDAAKIMALLAEKGEDGRVYCVSSGKAEELYKYIEIIKNKLSPKSELLRGAIPYPEGQVMHLVSDAAYKDIIGYEPETTFEEGIDKTVFWINSKKS